MTREEAIDILKDVIEFDIRRGTSTAGREHLDFEKIEEALRMGITALKNYPTPMNHDEWEDLKDSCIRRTEYATKINQNLGILGE